MNHGRALRRRLVVVVAMLTTLVGAGCPSTPPSPGAELRFERRATLETGSAESTSLVDVDGDGRVDLVTAANRTVSVHRARGGGFVRSGTVGFAPDEGVKGWGMADLDGDGDLDLVAATRAGGAEQATLLVGGETLTRSTLGVVPEVVERSILVVDFDGDGLDDLFVSGSSFRGTHGPDQLHRGLAGGGFDAVNVLDDVAPAPFWHERIEAPGTDCDGEDWANTWFKGVVVRDVDRDGRPDIVLNAFADAGFPDVRCPDAHQAFVTSSSYRGVFLLHNRSRPGEIRFEDASDAFAGDGYGNTLDHDQYYTSVPGDFDGDGDLDFVSGGVVFSGAARGRDTAAARVWRNDSTPGTPMFADTTADSGDLGALNELPPDEKATRRLSDGVAFDADNDGDLDIAFTNRDDGGDDDGTRGVVMFHNDGNMAFTEIEAAATGLEEYSNAINAADLTGDGLVDLVIDDKFFTERTYVFANSTTSTGHWIAIDTRDAQGAWPIGAIVTVFDTDGGVIGADEVRTDYSYRGKRQPTLHFGLGAADAVDVRIDLPHGGASTWHRRVPADQIVELAP